VTHGRNARWQVQDFLQEFLAGTQNAPE